MRVGECEGLKGVDKKKVGISIAVTIYDYPTDSMRILINTCFSAESLEVCRFKEKSKILKIYRSVEFY